MGKQTTNAKWIHEGELRWCGLKSPKRVGKIQQYYNTDIQVLYRTTQEGESRGS